MDINEINDLSRAELVGQHQTALRRAKFAAEVSDNKTYRTRSTWWKFIDAELTERGMASSAAVDAPLALIAPDLSGWT